VDGDVEGLMCQAVHYGHLFDAVPKSVATGRQDPHQLPPGWPLCPHTTEAGSG
jgi:hypothetical protein